MVEARRAQRRMAQDWMTNFISDNEPTVEEINNALVDFGFYHSFEQVARMYAEYTNNKLLGYAGGVNEQPDEYWRDLATMRWLRLWVENVKPMPRLAQRSVFDTLRDEGRFIGRLNTDGNS